MISVSLQGKPFNIMVIQVYAQPVMLKKLKLNGFMKTYKTLRTPKKDVLFIIGDWNAKVGSQETPGVTGKFGFGIHNEAEQRLECRCKFARMHWSQQTPSSNNTREDSTCGHHQMVDTEIRLIIFFAAKDGEALYSQKTQYRELTGAQIMNSLLPNSDLN